MPWKKGVGSSARLDISFHFVVTRSGVARLRHEPLDNAPEILSSSRSSRPAKSRHQKSRTKNTKDKNTNFVHRQRCGVCVLSVCQFELTTRQINKTKNALLNCSRIVFFFCCFWSVNICTYLTYQANSDLFYSNDLKKKWRVVCDRERNFSTRFNSPARNHSISMETRIIFLSSGIKQVGLVVITDIKKKKKIITKNRWKRGKYNTKSWPGWTCCDTARWNGKQVVLSNHHSSCVTGSLIYTPTHTGDTHTIRNTVSLI